MKNMTLGAFACALVLALASTPAHALSFDFSFTMTSGFTPGTVTGHIDGLQDNATGPATAVFIDSAPPVFNLTTPISVPIAGASGNSFTVTSGMIAPLGADFENVFRVSGTLYTLGMFTTTFDIGPPLYPRDWRLPPRRSSPQLGPCWSYHFFFSAWTDSGRWTARPDLGWRCSSPLGAPPSSADCLSRSCAVG
jgi:hypothetical protein